MTLHTTQADRTKPRSFVGALAVFYRDGDSIPVVPGGPYTAWVGHALVYLLGGLAHVTGLVAPGQHYIGKEKAT